MRLIDADALKEKINRTIEYADTEFDKGFNVGIEKAVYLIENAPTVDPFERIGSICNENCGIQRPTGKWINHEDGYNICPLCKYKTAFSYNFCPNCGADMRGDFHVQ